MVLSPPNTMVMLVDGARSLSLSLHIPLHDAEQGAGAARAMDGFATASHGPSGLTGGARRLLFTSSLSLTHSLTRWNSADRPTAVTARLPRGIGCRPLSCSHVCTHRGSVLIVVNGFTVKSKKETIARAALSFARPHETESLRALASLLSNAVM